jgi:hypothetical protein
MPRPQAHLEALEPRRSELRLAEEVQVIGQVGQLDAAGERVGRDPLDHGRVGLAVAPR